jgi:hypothetical protein
MTQAQRPQDLNCKKGHVMAQPPNPQDSRTKWIWVAVIAALAVLVAGLALNPSGDRDGTVDDPIVMDDPGDGTGVGQTPEPGENTTPPPEPFAPGGEPAE